MRVMVVLNIESDRKEACLGPFSQEIKQFFHTSLEKKIKLYIK